jgi:hypothetical protein
MSAVFCPLFVSRNTMLYYIYLNIQIGYENILHIHLATLYCCGTNTSVEGPLNSDFEFLRGHVAVGATTVQDPFLEWR